mgnify:FL=1
MTNEHHRFTATPHQRGILYRDRDTGTVVIYDKHLHTWRITAPGLSYLSALSVAQEMTQYIEATIYQSLV